MTFQFFRYFPSHLAEINKVARHITYNARTQATWFILLWLVLVVGNALLFYVANIGTIDNNVVAACAVVVNRVEPWLQDQRRRCNIFDNLYHKIRWDVSESIEKNWNHNVNVSEVARNYENLLREAKDGDVSYWHSVVG